MAGDSTQQQHGPEPTQPVANPLAATPTGLVTTPRDHHRPVPGSHQRVSVLATREAEHSSTDDCIPSRSAAVGAGLRSNLNPKP